MNNAKENYTKALKRLEELNNKIYDQENFAGFDANEKCSTNIEDELNDESVEYQSIEISANKKQSILTSTISNKKNQNGDDTIFDHPTLDQLVLEDDLDLNLNRLKNECLSQEKEKTEE